MDDLGEGGLSQCVAMNKNNKDEKRPRLLTGMASKAWPRFQPPHVPVPQDSFLGRKLRGAHTMRDCAYGPWQRCSIHAGILEGNWAYHVYLLFLSEFLVIEMYLREIAGKVQQEKNFK